MKTLVHVTHEAVQKIGGIGAVLQGVLTSRSYIDAVERTILLGPLFTTEGGAEDRLGPTGEVLYSSVDGLDKQNLLATDEIVEYDRPSTSTWCTAAAASSAIPRASRRPRRCC